MKKNKNSNRQHTPSSDADAAPDAPGRSWAWGAWGQPAPLSCWESGNGDPLFLQVKQAGPSVLERYAGASPYQYHGERVVRSQRIMQSASHMFLGWLTGAGEGHRSFYVRQLNDVKLKSFAATSPTRTWL